MRITTNSMLHNYQTNLINTTNRLNTAMTKVMTQRQFSSYATNPAAATQAFRIHSSLNSLQAQYDNNQSVTSKFETAWSNIQGILDDLTDDMGSVAALKGLNGTNLDDLDSQAQVLRGAAEAMVQSMNAKYNGDYIFAGSDNQNPPFAIEDGYITYRGVFIDKDLDQPYLVDGKEIQDENGKTITNGDMLKKWAEDDPLYVDVGLGFALDDGGNVLESTAFDSSISGIDILGYGEEDGIPKNLASIMLRLADVFDSYDSDAPEGVDPWGGNEGKAQELVDALQKTQQEVIDKHAALDVQAGFLNTNGTQLEANFDALNTERYNLEQVDPADAIMELTWAQTCYSAALQVGVNVIPQSLMDYLK